MFFVISTPSCNPFISRTLYTLFMLTVYCNIASCFRNFALNKRAYLSSTLNYNNFSWTADKAVDGNTDGSSPETSRTCSQTDIRMGNHTWDVDIGFLIIVKSITVYERNDGTDQLSGFQVLIGSYSWQRDKILLEKEPSRPYQHLFRGGDYLARFISVIRHNKESLTLCEVVVHGECLNGMYSTLCDQTCGRCSNGQPCNKDTGECFNGCEPGWTGILCDKGYRNFALNQRAYQSSTEHYNNFCWTADKAVDGNTDANDPDNSMTCSETDIHMGNHTWEVDIGFKIVVKSVTVYERRDGTDQLSGFQVFIGNYSSQRDTKSLEKASLGHFQHLFRGYDSVARFISVIRQNKITMTLCEVVVHGECLDGMYSTFCDHSCGKCFNGQPCNKDTGECLYGCEPGWTGILCDKASGEKLSETLSREDMATMLGTVVGICIGAVIISTIIAAVLTKRKSNARVDSEMRLNELELMTRAALGNVATKGIVSGNANFQKATQIAELEYEQIPHRGRIESSTYSMIQGRERAANRDERLHNAVQMTGDI